MEEKLKKIQDIIKATENQLMEEAGRWSFPYPVVHAYNTIKDILEEKADV